MGLNDIVNKQLKMAAFKDGRVSLIKKALELSKMTDAVIELRIYQKEDSSLVEYFS